MNLNNFPTPPAVGNTVAGVASIAGNTVVDAVLNVIPYVLPITAVLWGIRYALKKIKF